MAIQFFMVFTHLTFTTQTSLASLQHKDILIVNSVKAQPFESEPCVWDFWHNSNQHAAAHTFKVRHESEKLVFLAKLLLFLLPWWWFLKHLMHLLGIIGKMSKHFCDVLLAFICFWTKWTISAHSTLKMMLQFVVNSIKVARVFTLSRVTSLYLCFRTEEPD